LKNKNKKNKMLIIGHRGASAFEQENTIKAFEKAFELGADGFECDIRKSKDNKLVVIHDIDLKKASKGKEIRKVSELTAKQLRKYNIPLLQEVIDFAKKNPKKLLLIEIKEKGTEEDLADIIKKNKISKQVMVVSFFSSSINKIRQLFIPEKIKIGFIFSKLKPKPFPIALGIKTDFLIPNHSLVTKQLVDLAHHYKIKVLAWVIDDKKLALHLFNMGVDAIASNTLLK